MLFLATVAFFSQEAINYRPMTILIVPVVYLASLLLLFVLPPEKAAYSFFSWVVLFPVLRILRLIYKRRIEEAEQPPADIEQEKATRPAEKEQQGAASVQSGQHESVSDQHPQPFRAGS